MQNSSNSTGAYRKCPTNSHQHEEALKWFAYRHLPLKFQDVGEFFYEVAYELCEIVKPGTERTQALRKLLEAKDAAMRATTIPGG